MVNGRGYVIPEDIKEIAHEVLRHRLILTFEAEADEINTDKVIDIINLFEKHIYKSNQDIKSYLHR